MTWVCPSCGQEWPEKPLVDGTIGCPSCGNVAARDLIAARLAMEPTEPDGYAWWQAYRLDVTNLRARLSAAEQERDELRDELNSYETPLPYKVGYEDGKRAAEARAEALSHIPTILGRASSWLVSQDGATIELAPDEAAALDIALAAAPPAPEPPERPATKTKLDYSLRRAAMYRCPNSPDENGEWPCDPRGYFGVCQTCGRTGAWAAMPEREGGTT